MSHNKEKYNTNTVKYYYNRISTDGEKPAFNKENGFSELPVIVNYIVLNEGTTKKITRIHVLSRNFSGIYMEKLPYMETVL